MLPPIILSSNCPIQTLSAHFFFISSHPTNLLFMLHPTYHVPPNNSIFPHLTLGIYAATDFTWLITHYLHSPDCLLTQNHPHCIPKQPYWILSCLLFWPNPISSLARNSLIILEWQLITYYPAFAIIIYLSPSYFLSPYVQTLPSMHISFTHHPI